MRNVIRQSVVLPAPADRLFQMYLDPQTHGAITGAIIIGPLFFSVQRPVGRNEIAL